MVVHPTLVVASGRLANEAVRSLKNSWPRRLGTVGDALEVVQGGGLPAIELPLRQLLGQNRQIGLHMAGHPVQRVVHLIWVVDSPYTSIEEEIGWLNNWIDQTGILLDGHEFRVHILLLMPDLFELDEPGAQQARSNMNFLAPHPDLTPPTRVWPLSVVSQADLYLDQPQQVFPIVQLLVEACVDGIFPLHPTQATGRDWGGVGVCQLEVTPPQVGPIANQLWETLQTVDLGPPAGIPEVPLLNNHIPDWPRLPEKKNCFEPPDWFDEARWSTSLTSLREKYQDAVDQFEPPPAEPTPYALGRKALLNGVPHLKQLVSRLEALIDKTTLDLEKAYTPFDQLYGAEGKRSRFKRLTQRQELGRAVPVEEIADIQQTLDQVDSLLEGFPANALPEVDPAVARHKDLLADAASNFQNVMEQWSSQPSSEYPETPTVAPQGFWSQIFRRLAPRRPQMPDPKRLTPSQKERCDETWHYLQEGWEARRQLAERENYWLRQWSLLQQAQAYHRTIEQEWQYAREVLETITQFAPPQNQQNACNPLALEFRPKYTVEASTLRLSAEQLVKSGTLEYFWDKDSEGMSDRLYQAAQQISEGFARPTLASMLTRDTWNIAAVAATPRVAHQRYPDQQLHSYFRGDVRPGSWLESITYEHRPTPHESVLFRFVFPLQPDQIVHPSMVPTDQISAVTTPTPLQAIPNPNLSDPEPQLADLRPNSLLEELFK